MARSGGARPDASISLRELSRRSGISITRLHRAEVGQLRDGDLVADYERVLGLPRESLRAPIDILARTFPADAAPDLAVARSMVSDLPRARQDVRIVSDLTEQVTDAGAHATGGDWGLWARLLAPPRAVGLPMPLAEAALDRLVGELNRAAGTAYPSRYEALAAMRCSPYGDLVVSVVRARLNDPAVQVMEDMLSAVGDGTPAPAKTAAAAQRENARLRAQVEALTAELDSTKAVLDIVGKASGLLQAISDRQEPSKRSSRS